MAPLLDVEHSHDNWRGGIFLCTRPHCREAAILADRQARENPDITLAEMVENLEIGTIFIDIDDLGRRTEWMRVWGGVIAHNGQRNGPLHYGDRWDDNYSIEVTHTGSQPINK